MLVIPACLARPILELKAQEGWTGLQAWAAKPLVGTGHGGAGTRSSCGSHKSTWWQSGRLQHAEPGKSAPATRAGGRVAGLHREVGPAQGWGEGAIPGLLRDSAPQSPQRLSEQDKAFASWGIEEGGTGQPGIGGIHSSASTSLVPRSPPFHPRRSFSPPPPLPSSLRCPSSTASWAVVT